MTVLPVQGSDAEDDVTAAAEPGAFAPDAEPEPDVLIERETGDAEAPPATSETPFRTPAGNRVDPAADD